MKSEVRRLRNLSIGDEIVTRVNRLAAISEAPVQITRVLFTPEHRAAADLLLSWMGDAGMDAHLDAIGNVCGRYEGERPGLPCLMLGSHYDTVRDAGKWDGPLGLITAISCVAAYPMISSMPGILGCSTASPTAAPRSASNGSIPI